MVDRRQELVRLLGHNADPLTRLVIGDELARELRVIVRQAALDAHDAGYTWQDIGDALGVSRAAAHERFSPQNRRAARRRRRVR